MFKTEAKEAESPPQKQYFDHELRLFHDKLQAKLPEIKSMNVGQMEFVAWKLGYMNRYEQKDAEGKVYYRFTICAKEFDGKFDYTSWRKFESFWNQYNKWVDKQAFKAQTLVEVTKEVEETERVETVEDKIARDVEDFDRDTGNW
jgi:hypothetical protein